MSKPRHTTPRPSESHVHEPTEPAYEPVAEEEWPDESEELPRRPRRRLLTPVPLALLAALLIACGFIAGVLVEKGQTSSSSSSGSAASLASRFAAQRGAAPARAEPAALPKPARQPPAVVGLRADREARAAAEQLPDRSPTYPAARCT